MHKFWMFVVVLGFCVGAVVPQAQAQAPAKNVIAAMPGNVFVPRMLVIRAGESVTWMNGGGFHNVNADDGSFRCANGCDQDGGKGEPAANPWSFTLTFKTPGVVPFFCEVHGAPRGMGMSGMVIVQGSDAARLPEPPATPAAAADDRAAELEVSGSGPIQP